MKSPSSLICALLLLCSLCLSTAAPAADPKVSLVESVEILAAEGGRVSWSPDGEWIAVDLKGEDGYFDIWVMRPDKSGKNCLTCDKAGRVPQKHNGTAEWHPSGE